MTSGLPNYTDSPLVNAEEYRDITRVWKNSELIGYVYPKKSFDPPLKKGYFYTNTGYILLDFIIERITANTFSNFISEKIIAPAQLQNTFYPSSSTSPSVFKRLAHGYNYNQYDNPSLVGHDMYGNNLSWAGAAGAMISNSEDIIHWVNAIFVENTLLNSAQKKQLTELISLNTGKSIKVTTKNDPRGFGLGVVQGYDEDLGNNFWFYQGETLGFRAFYMYVPCNGVIISTIMNSATNEENNHIHLLMKTVYHTILNKNAHLRCQK
jgi:D-alanyl-D-alanine carboxypeptidase